MKIEDIDFDLMKVVLMMEKHPKLLKVFKDQRFGDDIDHLKILIKERFLNYKAKVALKKVFKAIQGGSEAIQVEYDQLEYDENEIFPVDGKRYYVWCIEETNGEYSYHHKGVATLDEKEDSTKWLEEYTSTFYNDEGGDEDDGGYWFNGEIICEPYDMKEVTRDEYEVVKKYI